MKKEDLHTTDRERKRDKLIHVIFYYLPSKASILRRVLFCNPESSCSGNTIVAGISFFIGLMKWNPLHDSNSSHPLTDPSLDSIVLLLATLGSV